MSATALDGRGGLARSGDRSVQAGVVLAAVGHALLLVLLSLARGPQEPRVWPEPTPLEVSLVTEVTPEAQAPADPTPPAPSIAPEVGAPEEAAPAPVPVPEPARPAPPQPTPAKPTPAKPAPAKPAPPQPVAVKPAPAPKPAPVKHAPARPAPAAKPAAAKPQATAAAKPAPARPTARPTARPSRLAGLIPSTAAGTNPAATAARPRGRRLGDNFLAGLSADAPERRPSAAAPAAKVGPYPTASIVGAIARQIQPCADRQVNPGPGANRITTTLNVRLNPDGSLAATPTKVKQSGVDDENDRYAQRVVDLGVAAFKGCSPLKLPSEYYRTGNGGWSNINYQWKLR